jgi:hypothetical protein
MTDRSGDTAAMCAPHPRRSLAGHQVKESDMDVQITGIEVAIKSMLEEYQEKHLKARRSGGQAKDARVNHASGAIQALSRMLNKIENARARAQEHGYRTMMVSIF